MTKVSTGPPTPLLPAGPSESHLSTRRPTRVLLVEDDADGREVMSIALELHDIEVCAVDGAHNALLEIELRAFDVLVSDLGMPQIDGYTLMRRIRVHSSDAIRKVPSIALTAFSNVSSTALAAGFDRYLTKPVNLDLFVATIRELSARA